MDALLLLLLSLLLLVLISKVVTDDDDMSLLELSCGGTRQSPVVLPDLAFDWVVAMEGLCWLSLFFKWVCHTFLISLSVRPGNLAAIADHLENKTQQVHVILLTHFDLINQNFCNFMSREERLCAPPHYVLIHMISVCVSFCQFNTKELWT